MTSQPHRWHHSLVLRCYGALRPNGLMAALVIIVLCQAVASAQFAYQKIVTLGHATDSGSTPFSSLITGPDGALYGTTYGGGVSNVGTIYKLNKDGSGYQPLYSFKGQPGDGEHPYGPLAMGTNGVLFGTTEFGGSNSVGTLFMMKSDGSGYRVLVHFGGSPGSYPRGQLILGDDGNLYGTSRFSGTSGGGTIYKIRHDGGGFQVVYNLAAPALTGWDQRAWLLRASDGRFYGTCFEGGTDGFGTVFGINQDGSDFTTLYNFKGTNFADGAGPHAPLIEGKDGFLYGTTQNGGLPSPFLGSGDPGWGTVFKIRKDGSDYRVLHLMDADHGEPAVNYGGVEHARARKSFEALKCQESVQRIEAAAIFANGIDRSVISGATCQRRPVKSACSTFQEAGAGPLRVARQYTEPPHDAEIRTIGLEPIDRPRTSC